jgi:acyl-coenzyme A thioesterase PaaI-like protein
MTKISIDELSPEEWEERRRLVRATRRVLSGVNEINTPLDHVTALADEAEALAAQLERNARAPMNKLAEREPGPVAADELNGLLPFSPITGRLNPISPPLDMSVEGDRVIGAVRLGVAYQGAPGFAHGAVVAGIWDEVLAMATVRQGMMGPTAFLNIKYRKPTRLDVDLRYESWIERVEGRKIWARGACHEGELRVSTAEAMFIHFDPENPHPDWDQGRGQGDLSP